MSHGSSVGAPGVGAVSDVGVQVGGDWQVILFNDDVNEAGQVARILMRVFGHPRALAWKIMMEAHRTGRAIAQVEPESPARLHADQLRSHRLQAAVERIG
jgi:ATP-dependent Clp protease adapter protein ClpS